MTPKTFYLASKSPRRKQILQQLGFNPIVLATNDHTLKAFQGDEEPIKGERPEEYVLRVSKEKALIALQKIQTQGLAPYPVLAADTTVICRGEILGKPVNEQQARRFLEMMSGTVHEVRTAVWVGGNAQTLTAAVSVSHVHFKRLTEEEIRAYVSTAEPYDKAGGYAVQGLAAAFIERIEGSYSGIMGLPVFETVQLLKKFDIRLF
ncbi:MAG TPA: septum formation inhibitor Maf [Candidatus Aphodousia gallistercoris]|nr:septum formation inhibitor Maf [Candidatus Aphodousia gallistercoris]